MGVKGLWKILEPSSVAVDLDELRGKVLAVDVSFWIYQFLRAAPASASPTKFCIEGFFHRMCKLLYYNVFPVLVFDGPAVPLLKMETMRKRQDIHDREVLKVNRLLSKWLRSKLSAALLAQPEGAVPNTDTSGIVEGGSAVSGNSTFIHQHLAHPPSAAEPVGDEDSDRPFSGKIDCSVAPFSDDFRRLSLLEQQKILLFYRFSPFAADPCGGGKSDIYSEDFSKSQLLRASQKGKITKALDDIKEKLKASSENGHIVRCTAPNAVSENKEPVLSSVYDRVFSAKIVNLDDKAANTPPSVGTDGPSVAFLSFEDICDPFLEKNTEQDLSENHHDVLDERESDNRQAGFAEDNDGGLGFCDSHLGCKEASRHSTDVSGEEDVLFEEVEICPNAQSVKSDWTAQAVREEKSLSKLAAGFEKKGSIFAKNPDEAFVFDAGTKGVEAGKDCVRERHGAKQENTRDLNSGHASFNRKERDIYRESADRPEFNIKGGLHDKSGPADTTATNILEEDESSGTEGTENASKSHTTGRCLDDESVPFLEGKDFDFVELNHERLLSALKKESKKAYRPNQDLDALLKELASLCGIAAIDSPMEAEAQCAWMCARGLVDGVCSDDSDVIVFGSSFRMKEKNANGNEDSVVVYRNLFRKNSRIERYSLDGIEEQLGIDHDTLLSLVYLLGSDYNDGLYGVGVVTALEICSIFKTLSSSSTLSCFLDWHGNPSSEDSKKQEKAFPSLHRLRRKLTRLPDNFPDPRVRSAFENPSVANTTLPFYDKEFSRAKPPAIRHQLDTDGLTRFMHLNANWECSKTTSHLAPVLRKLSDNEKVQMVFSVY